MVTTYILVGGVCLLIGMIIGFIMGRMKRYYDGVFRVNTSDPNKDVFTLELSCAIGDIPNKRYLAFRVENISSQEKPLA